MRNIADAVTGAAGVSLTLANISAVCSLIVTIFVIVYYVIRLSTMKRDRETKRRIEQLEIQIKEQQLKDLEQHNKEHDVK